MLHASTKRLIEKLGERTRKKKVAWIESSDGSVIHETEGYRVLVTAAPHAVKVTDIDGKELEVVTPDDLNEVADESGRPYRQFVSELFADASRQAKGTEKAIESLLRGLDLDGDGIPDVPLPDEKATFADTSAFVETDAPVEIIEPVELPTKVSPEAPQSVEQAVRDMADEVNQTTETFDDATVVDVEQPTLNAPIVGAAALGAAAVATGLSAKAATPPETTVSTEPEPTKERPNFGAFGGASNLSQYKAAGEAQDELTKPQPIETETVSRVQAGLSPAETIPPTDKQLTRKSFSLRDAGLNTPATQVGVPAATIPVVEQGVNRVTKENVVEATPEVKVNPIVKEVPLATIESPEGPENAIPKFIDGTVDLPDLPVEGVTDAADGLADSVKSKVKDGAGAVSGLAAGIGAKLTGEEDEDDDKGVRRVTDRINPWK